MKIEQLSVNDWVAIDGVPSKVMSIDSFRCLQQGGMGAEAI